MNIAFYVMSIFSNKLFNFIIIEFPYLYIILIIYDLYMNKLFKVVL